MENKKVLYISQEIMPFVPENEMSYISRYLPQGIQERGKEIIISTDDSNIPVWVIPTNEELMIAQHTLNLYKQHP